MPSVAVSFSLMQTGSIHEAYGIPYRLALCSREYAGLAWDSWVHRLHLPSIRWKGCLMINELRYRYFVWRTIRRFRRQINRLIIEDYGDWGVMSW